VVRERKKDEKREKKKEALVLKLVSYLKRV
jgi:hypothetical protein